VQNFLDIQNGKPMAGIHVNDKKFQGVTSLDQLEDYGLSRPSRLENAKVKERKDDKKLSDSCSLRDAIQRRFDKKRIVRAEAYAAYIKAVEYGGQFGGTPPITLYLSTARGLEADCLVVPYGAVLLAIDGETQTEARFLLREEVPDSGSLHVAVTVYHDCTEEFAKQILHDYNRYASPVREKELMTINPEGPLTRVARQAIESAEIAEDRVNRHGVKPGKNQDIAQIQVMYAVAGYTLQDRALENSADRWLEELNNPAMGQTLRGTNGSCVSAISLLSKSAVGSSEARTAAPLVWQVAGAVVAKGRAPETIKWAEAVAALRGMGRAGARRKLDSVAAAI
jgi:hypothetical protein